MNARQTDSLRLFFALWPDDATRSALMQIQASMRGRLVPYENLHITLAFLGERPAELLPKLRDILTHLPRTEVALTIDKLGYFSRNKIAWAGMSKAPNELMALQKTLAQMLLDAGIEFNGHAEFKPHITLARDASLPADMVFTPIPWKANQAALVQSVTRAEGPSYQVLASRSLDQEVWIPGQM